MFVPEWLVRRNEALGSNPPDAQEHISTNASDWLWAAFSLITLCTLVMAVFTFMVSALRCICLTAELTTFPEAKGLPSVPPNRVDDPYDHYPLLLLHGFRPRLYSHRH